MIKKVRLTNINDKTVDKNGAALKTKDGKPYTRRLIKCEQHGDTLLSGFKSPWNESWKEGDEVTIDIEEVKKDGRVYLNFKKVDMLDRVMGMLNDLNERVSNLEQLKNKGYIHPENNGDVPFDDEPPVE